MRYRVFVRDPEIGYRDRWLWLPKKHISEEITKSSLEIPYPSGSKSKLLPLWREESDHLLVPREFVQESELSFEVMDLVPEFDKVEIESSIKLDKLWPDQNIQREAFEDLKDKKGGILNLRCGGGKTIIFLHAAAYWGEPILIIGNQEHILLQWKNAIEKYIKFDGELGWVQGPPKKWRWKHPITLAMLHSLAYHADNLPEGFSSWPGRIIWDEIHHLSAMTFSKTASLFLGNRYGASATVNRPDGTEVLYLSHVGPVIHSNLEQDIVPAVIFKRSHTEIDLTDGEVIRECYSCNGEVHHRKLAAYVGTLPEELQLCKSVIENGLQKGRRILALSQSRKQAIELNKMFPESGLVISGNPSKPKERLEIIKQKDLVFATADLAREALDEDRLDSLIILSEFSDANLLQQAVGRIQRKLVSGNKKPSKVVIIFHVRVPMMRAMGANLKKHFRRWDIKTETIG